jgi:NDP-sugar pyrophosphorylase family protein
MTSPRQSKLFVTSINAADRTEEAVILCGGLGTRLREVAPDRPKALLEVSGRPFLEWLLLRLARRDGIRHVILATGHLAEMIEHHFGHQTWCGLTVSYSRETKPLGTAGAVRLAATLTHSPNVLVLNGDTYCDYDLRRLFEAQVTNKAAATLWLSKVNDPRRFGSVAIDSQGRIQGFHEKGATGGRQLANAGVYLLRRDVVATIPSDRVVSLEFDVFPSLVGKGLYGVEGTGSFVDIGTPESLNRAGDALEGELDGLNCD